MSWSVSRSWRMQWLTMGLIFATPFSVMSAEPDSVRRGAYLLRAAGGCGCHTNFENDGEFLAGGRPLKTPFGTFYGTNITPDRETGIGGWSEAEFVRAMTEGLAPGGRHLFPVFPYPSFAGMEREHLRDLWAYLRTVRPVRRSNTPHEIIPPFGWRLGIPSWKWLFFDPAPFRSDPRRSDRWNRGAYLVRSVGHCGECHTPRNLAGAPKKAWTLAGSRDGPEGQFAPNLTPDFATGLGEWSREDIIWYLQTGSDPGGESAEGLMGDVIEHGFSKLTEDDLGSIADYLKSLDPIANSDVKKPR